METLPLLISDAKKAEQVPGNNAAAQEQYRSQQLNILHLNIQLNDLFVQNNRAVGNVPSQGGNQKFDKLSKGQFG